MNLPRFSGRRAFGLAVAVALFLRLAGAGEATRAEKIRDSLRDPGDRTVLVAAHRGGYADDRADRAPENSVANVAVAVARGFDVYETDIRRTRDGVFVIVHDDTIDRETDGTGPVEALDFSEVARLRKRYRDGSISDEGVATLETLLEAGRGRILFKADLKPGVIEHFEEMAILIDRLGMADDVFLRTSLRDADPIAEAFARGVPRVEVMFKVDRAEQVTSVAKRFSPATIQVNVARDETDLDGKRKAIETGARLGLCVETHSYGEPDFWETLAEAGVRMFHSAVPDRTLDYLRSAGWREAFTTGN